MFPFECTPAPTIAGLCPAPGPLLRVRLYIPPPRGGSVGLGFHCVDCASTVLELRADERGMPCRLGLPMPIGIVLPN